MFPLIFSSSITRCFNAISSALLLLGGLGTACAPADTESFKVNLGIPVRSQRPYEFEKKFFTLSQQIPNPICRQNQVLLIVRDQQTGQTLSTQKIKLISQKHDIASSPSPFGYNATPVDLDMVLNYLTQNSELEEQPVITKPLTQNASIHLIGAFFNPVNVNNNVNQACDAFDFQSPKDRFFSIEQPVPNITGSSTLSGRVGHTATLLNNGKILVIGGIADSTSGTTPTVTTGDVSLFDPDTGSWIASGTPADPDDLTESRAYHTATLLPDGRVVVIGGVDYTVSNSAGTIITPRTSIEIYDPEDNQWNTLSATLLSGRYHHTANLITSGANNGKILVVGGKSTITTLLNTYFFLDPSVGATTPISSSVLIPFLSGFQGIYRHTATPLSDGRILFFGGGIKLLTGPSTETTTNKTFIYDPSTSLFSSFTPPSGLVARAFHTATLLDNGNVAFIGGSSSLSTPIPLSDIAILTPSPTVSWTLINTAITGRFAHTATKMEDGTILISGGEIAGGGFTASNEIFDPSNNGITPLDPTTNIKHKLYSSVGYRTAVLSGDKVVMIGGSQGSGFSPESSPRSEVDVYDFKRLAAKSTILSAKSMIDENAISSGTINLNIHVLHANPYITYNINTSNINQFKNFVGIGAEFFYNNNGTNNPETQFRPAQITIPPPNQNYASLIFPIDTNSNQSYYLPNFFPMQMELRLFSGNVQYSSICANTGGGCVGRYKTNIEGTGPLTNSVLTRMPRFSSKGNIPPASLTGSNLTNFTMDDYGN